MVHDDREDADAGGGIPTEMLASYLAFGVRAVRRHRVLAVALFVSIAGLTIAIGKLWPRTYHAEARLIAQQNQVLTIRDSVNDALRGAPDLILRQENLESIATKLDLLNVMRARRPFIVRMRDAVTEAMHGPIDPKIAQEALIWTLKDKLSVQVSQGDATLTVAIDWSDAGMSAQILQAADDNFLEARHVAEVSTISQYASILEDHTKTIRDEIDQIAGQLKELKAKQRADFIERKKKSYTEADATGAPVRHVGMRAAAHHLELDEELPRLKATLEAKQRSIADLEDYRTRHLTELQGKLAELQTQYTAAHPAILDVQTSIAAASRESAQVTGLRSEVSEIQAEIDRRNAAAKSATDTTPGATTAYMGSAGAAAPLPAEIMSLIQDTSDDNTDPAVEAQLRYAVEKYTTLRGQISNARIDLDTAEVAFKYRYKIVSPPEIPNKATKPKVPLIVGAGFLLAIVLALLAPILVELRSGRIVESWQMNELQLPVLGELRFPPRAGSDPPRSGRSGRSG